MGKAMLALVRDTSDEHQKEQVKVKVDTYTKSIRDAIQNILDIIKKPEAHTSLDFEQNLSQISSFFQNEKFQSIVLPVLHAILVKDRDLWEAAMEGENGKIITPDGFEYLPRSFPEMKDEHGKVIPMQNIRELQLLEVYGVNLDIIFDTFGNLKRNR